jgi:hypothetical protein
MTALSLPLTGYGDSGAGAVHLPGSPAGRSAITSNIEGDHPTSMPALS